MSTEMLEKRAEGAAALCLNCATPLTGHYCSRCGQAHRPLNPSVHDLLHEATHEFVHLDGKILETLRLLAFFPGRLSAEFLAGRRARFIGPIRLYLTMSLLFFLLLAHDSGQHNTKNQPETAKVSVNLKAEKDTSDAEQAHMKWLSDAVKKGLADPERFHHELLANLSHVMFVLVPLFALALRVIYFKRRFRYPAYVYFSLHYHAFVFLLFSMMLALNLLKIGALSTAMDWIVWGGVPGYLFLALRRSFGGSRWRTALRMAALGAFYLPCLLSGMLAAIGLTLLWE